MEKTSPPDLRDIRPVSIPQKAGQNPRPFFRPLRNLFFIALLAVGSFTLGYSVTQATITLDSTSVTSDGNLFLLPTGAGKLGVNINTTPSSTIHVSGTALFKPGTDSTTAFQIQNALGHPVCL